MEPRYEVQLKIRKPAAEVFDAVVKPEKLTGYFVGASSAPLTTGATVKWTFAEFPGEHEVRVLSVVKDQRVAFEWKAPTGDHQILVEMAFVPLGPEATMVKISESGWRDTREDMKASHRNAGGWMHMMASLKGYLEYGINLRAGGA